MIKARRLVRGSTLGALSDAGRQSMLTHGIRTVVDLRGDDEVSALPSPFAAGTRYRRVPLNSLRMMALHEAAHAGTLEQELRTIATQDDGLSRVMRAIAESEPAVLVHCVAGRDRTGLIVALVLAAIGVSDADIVADYVASDAALAAEYARFKAENPDKAAAVDEAIAKRAWVMAETLRTLRTSFGDASRYLAYAGVTAPTIAALHESLTR